MVSNHATTKGKILNFGAVILAVLIAVALATLFVKQDETTGDFKLKVPFKK